MTDNAVILASLKLSPKRFKHTLGVAETASELARRHFPEYSASEVEAAALMHDYTKELALEEQLALCEKYSISLTEPERKMPKLLHAKTAAAVARREFGLSENVVSAVRWHTTGKADMTGLEAIIYLADYIEPNRSDEGCRRLREYYYKKLGTEDARTAFLKTLVKSFDTTVIYLLEERKIINPDTVEARNYYVELLETEKK